MIKINKDNFNWQKINEIYKDDFTILIEPLSKKISDNLHELPEYIITLFKDWFYEDGDISLPKISAFLLDDDPIKKINEFDLAISNMFDGKDKKFSRLITDWPISREASLSSKSFQERKEIITGIISPENIDLFEGISKKELNSEPIRGTVYSNKERIKKIALKREKKIEDILSFLAKKIFTYETLFRDFRNELLAAMKIDVCPYCNRQYITSYHSTKGAGATADIDHFYGQAQYPFLALSLYNLIPSCQICNSRFKSTSDFGHKKHCYPYNRGFDRDAVFKIQDNAFLWQGFMHNQDIKFGIENPKNIEEIENSIATFHLNEIYQSHQDYVKEVIKKAKIYGDGSQFEEFLSHFENLFTSKSEMQRIVFGNYLDEKELDKRPLAKLTKDLLDDLNIEIER